MTTGAIGEPVGEDADLGPVGVLDAGELGAMPSGRTVTTGTAGVGLLEQGARSARSGATLHVAMSPRRTAAVRREGDREAEQLRDLGHVLMRADAIRRDVLEHRAGVGRCLQRAAGARHPGEAVDDDGAGLDRVLQRREREQVAVA
jgi:hypothetical protein